MRDRPTTETHHPDRHAQRLPLRPRAAWLALVLGVLCAAAAGAALAAATAADASLQTASADSGRSFVAAADYRRVLQRLADLRAAPPTDPLVCLLAAPPRANAP